MIKNITTIEFASLMGFPKPANDTMYSIVLLLSEMTILLTFIFFGVLLALAYIIDIFNAENNPYPRHFEKTVESTLDVIFVIFPTIIIIYLLIPSLGFIFNNETLVETVFNINVIGHQWYWSYEYNYSLGTSLYGLLVDEYTLINQLEFDSLLDQETTYNRLLQVDKRVIIPVNTLIQATVTSQDVIHSWSVPQLGIKYDAIPGRLITFILHSNVEGIFYGQCSELCGVNHAFMPICVQAVDVKTFLNWLLLSTGMNPSKNILELIYVNVELISKYAAIFSNSVFVFAKLTCDFIIMAITIYCQTVISNILFNLFCTIDSYEILYAGFIEFREGTTPEYRSYLYSSFFIEAEENKKNQYQYVEEEVYFDTFSKWLFFSLFMLWFFGMVFGPPPQVLRKGKWVRKPITKYPEYYLYAWWYKVTSSD